ncbi:Uncharacterized protein HZ326_0715 [Fusarium oxysporum f. sp. albedinis]|nr:Uncharacterized protein HZ326_0715 [Fusarium oxysporum f. sp. albedinis]
MSEPHVSTFTAINQCVVMNRFRMPVDFSRFMLGHHLTRGNRTHASDLARNMRQASSDDVGVLASKRPFSRAWQRSVCMASQADASIYIFPHHIKQLTSTRSVNITQIIMLGLTSAVDGLILKSLRV